MLVFILLAPLVIVFSFFFVNTRPHDVLNECITLRYVFSPDATSLEAELRSACVHTQSECSHRNNFTREKIWSRKLS